MNNFSIKITEWFDKNKDLLHKWLNKKGYKKITVGQYARKKITELLTTKKISQVDIDNLKDKQYSLETFDVCFPILVELSDSFDKKRYYTKHLVLGKYLITNEWHNYNKKSLDNWLNRR